MYKINWPLFILNVILVYAIMWFVFAPWLLRMLVSLLVFMGLYRVEYMLIPYLRRRPLISKTTIIKKRKTIWDDDK